MIDFESKMSKIPQVAKQAHCEILQTNKKTNLVVVNEKFKTCIGFEIGQRQQKCQCRPTLQALANQDVEQGHTHRHAHSVRSSNRTYMNGAVICLVQGLLTC